jgi:hypothetical protein
MLTCRLRSGPATSSCSSPVASPFAAPTRAVYHWRSVALTLFDPITVDLYRNGNAILRTSSGNPISGCTRLPTRCLAIFQCLSFWRMREKKVTRLSWNGWFTDCLHMRSPRCLDSTTTPRISQRLGRLSENTRFATAMRSEGLTLSSNVTGVFVW